MGPQTGQSEPRGAAERPSATPQMRIAILTDTHLPGLIRAMDELGPQPADFFSQADLILHSGDLTSPMVLDWLERFAPVLAATGNNDPIEDDRSQPVQTLEREGWKIGMTHDVVPETRPVAELRSAFSDESLDVLISGHTHLDRLEAREGVVLLNSGSPTFPHHKSVRLGTVGLLVLEPDLLRAGIVLLGETPERPNPGKAMQITVKR